MRQISMLIAAAVLACSCATSAPEQSPEASGLTESGQPLASVVSQRLPEQAVSRDAGFQPDDPPEQPHVPSGTTHPADTVESAAAQAIIRLIEDEGLLVLGIESEIKAREGTRTRILTTVLYGTGRSHPREASYLVEMESTGDNWTIVSIGAAS